MGHSSAREVNQDEMSREGYDILHKTRRYDENDVLIDL